MSHHRHQIDVQKALFCYCTEHHSLSDATQGQNSIPISQYQSLSLEMNIKLSEEDTSTLFTDRKNVHSTYLYTLHIIYTEIIIYMEMIYT